MGGGKRIRASNKKPRNFQSWAQLPNVTPRRFPLPAPAPLQLCCESEADSWDALRSHLTRALCQVEKRVRCDLKRHENRGFCNACWAMIQICVWLSYDNMFSDPRSLVCTTCYLPTLASGFMSSISTYTAFMATPTPYVRRKSAGVNEWNLTLFSRKFDRIKRLWRGFCEIHGPDKI